MDDDLKKMMNASIEKYDDEARKNTVHSATKKFSDRKEYKHRMKQSVWGLVAASLCVFFISAVSENMTLSGGGRTDNETSLINSMQLTQYPAGVRTAVVRMVLGGINPKDISFDEPELDDFLKDKKAVFYPAGGGISYRMAAPDVMQSGYEGQWIFNGENEIVGLGKNFEIANGDSAQIIAFLPGISEDACRRINRELGLPEEPPSVEGVDFQTTMGKSAHGFCNQGCGGRIGGESGNDPLYGQPYGCFYSPSYKVHVYYHLILEQ
ncbi:MAG: hypothetical protein ACK4NR_05020 [Micavibrio sp.]